MVTAYDSWHAETRRDKAASYDSFLKMGGEVLK